MFSVVFPGQGSQAIGMGKEFFDKYNLVQNYFKEADEALNFNISKLILEGPKDNLDMTINTQPAIFLTSYAIFNVIKIEHNIDLTKANFFAGHSLGEYSALACAGYLDFVETLKVLKLRGEYMQNAVPKGAGGMLAVLGISTENLEKIINENQDKFRAQIANDNSEGQIVVSGKLEDINKMTAILKINKIKNIQLPVSAPFHCSLMKKATENMIGPLNNLNFKDAKINIVSNVTASAVNDIIQIKELLIKQIENRVRWRESVQKMINEGVNNFIEIGPGKVLAGLIKRINKDINTLSINSEDDIKNLKI
ncbi:ACP S-malonyltransferase [Candidatus Pelagibacter sp.]|uniref:ACP S-malonyltransferase n=1 Tax=Candidatus Pelagibacter sp. TaxID=2024849 RepID=UPI003F83D084